MEQLHRIGTALRIQRKKLGMTISQVARASRTSRAEVIKCESGTGALTLTHSLSILNAVGLELEIVPTTQLSRERFKALAEITSREEQ